jgi:hypothetical protein
VEGTAHESFNHDEPVQGSSDRSFGLTMAAVFALIGLVSLIAHGSWRLWPFAVALFFLLPALWMPRMLRPLNRAWLRFGLLLHRIVSPIVLGIMFFLVITPMALMMRLVGKDLLRRRLDERAESYWIERSPPGPARDTLKYQF